MRIAEPTSTLVSTATELPTMTSRVDPEGARRMMEMLVNLYADRRLAVAREYVSNAVDATRAAGGADPVEVTTPTLIEPSLIVTDRGTGMSLAEVEATFLAFAASSKRDSNEMVGGLGVGAKSAWTWRVRAQSGRSRWERVEDSREDVFEAVSARAEMSATLVVTGVPSGRVLSRFATFLAERHTTIRPLIAVPEGCTTLALNVFGPGNQLTGQTWQVGDDTEGIAVRYTFEQWNAAMAGRRVTRGPSKGYDCKIVDRDGGARRDAVLSGSGIAALGLPVIYTDDADYQARNGQPASVTVHLGRRKSGPLLAAVPKAMTRGAWLERRFATETAGWSSVGRGQQLLSASVLIAASDPTYGPVRRYLVDEHGEDFATVRDLVDRFRTGVKQATVEAVTVVDGDTAQTEAEPYRITHGDPVEEVVLAAAIRLTNSDANLAPLGAFLRRLERNPSPASRSQFVRVAQCRRFHVDHRGTHRRLQVGARGRTLCPPGQGAGHRAGPGRHR